MSTIVLGKREFQVLAEGAYILCEIYGANSMWRLAHENCASRMPELVNRHVSLSAAEIDLIGRDPAGLVVGETTIRRAAS